MNVVMVMKKNGFTTLELLMVVVVFSIIYFIGVSSITNIFSYNKEDVAYEEKLNLIKKQATTYAIMNEGFFEEKNIVYIYVKDLVEANYLATNEEGIVKDPRHINKNLNNLKIKIIKENDEIKANIVKL